MKFIGFLASPAHPFQLAISTSSSVRSAHARACVEHGHHMRASFSGTMSSSTQHHPSPHSSLPFATPRSDGHPSSPPSSCTQI